MTAPAGSSAYRPVLGPVDRVSFLAEQSRNRRASWLLAVFAVAAIVVTGIPLGVIAAPLLYATVMPIGLVMTVLHPHSAWSLLLVMPATLLPMLFAVAFQSSHVTHIGWPVVIAMMVLTVLPGAIAFLAIWLIVRRVLRRAGADALLHRFGARAPDAGDAEERQLVDLVEEIAVAAGIPAPRVAIIDSAAAGGAANAAAVGWSISDATVVVTRPLLDLLTRDQAQAVVARVVASVGNGDLRIAFLMLSIFQSVRIVQFALFGASRWRTLRIFWRCVRSAVSRPEPSNDQAVAADLLAVSEYHVGLDVALKGPTSLLGCLFAPVLLPFRFSAWTLGFIISASEYFITGPLVDAAWRRRELLSDATTVRLTRNPDGLAGALERFRESGTIVPHADLMSYLFACWWPGARPGQAAQPIVLFARKTHVAPARRIAQLVAMGAHPESTAVAPDDSSARTVMTGFLGLAFVNVVGVMMFLAMWLTSIELFVLGALGLRLAAAWSVRL